MASRKELVKYFPKNFDPQLLVKRGRGKDKLIIVRNMLPMSLRCNTCSNYLYIGTKFNMRMQICNDQTYLGIKVFRFYLKCTYCYSDITFKTDPKNHDYVVQIGGTRNYQPLRDAQQAQKLIKKMKKDEKQEDSMKFLQNKTYNSKRQMQINDALEDIRNLNKRKAVIDPQDLLKNMIYAENQQKQFTKTQLNQIDKKFQQLQQKRCYEQMKNQNQKEQSKLLKNQKQQAQKDKIINKVQLKNKIIKNQILAKNTNLISKILINSFKDQYQFKNKNYKNKTLKKKIIKKSQASFNNKLKEQQKQQN